MTESPYDYCKTNANSMLAIQEACDYKSHLTGCVHGEPQPTALDLLFQASVSRNHPPSKMTSAQADRQFKTTENFSRFFIFHLIPKWHDDGNCELTFA